eukprot:13896280-Ditylum_brightwellii.AAC.1
MFCAELLQQDSPALEESDCSDDDGDLTTCCVLEDPLYHLDNLLEVDKKLIEVYMFCMELLQQTE